VPKDWLEADVKVRGGGKKPRKDLAGLSNFQIPKDLRIPVRWLNVLYALPNPLYKEWTKEQIPEPHEYFIRYSSVKTDTSPTAQKFLAGLTLRSHFLTEPGK
jgi:hypothetical protein